MDYTDILADIKQKRTLGEQNIDNMKMEIEADIALIHGKKKPWKEKLIWDFSMSSRIYNFVARSYTTKTPIYIRSTKNGGERIAKAQNKMYQEDRDSPMMKAIRYYKDVDKFSTGIAILAKLWWDGKKKSPIWTRINPLLAVPDPYGDYFSGDYRYIGFYWVKTEQEMDSLRWDKDVSGDTVNWEKERKRTEQMNWGVNPSDDKTVFDVYYHFDIEEDGSCTMYVTNGNCTHLHTKKKLKRSPFVFYYWRPNGTFFGDRPANYIRDVQKFKAEMINLQADKVRQEVYGMWLYNSDFVSGKDIWFWVNKKIPIKTGLDWANVSLSNIVSKVPTDTKISDTTAFVQAIEQDVSLALSQDKIVQWSLPDRRETAKTNSMVVDNADISLSLHEEMDAIGEQVFVEIWYDTYREKFTEADKKIVYAGTSTGRSPQIITRKDFIIEWNLSLEIETSQEREDRMRKESAWRTQVSPLILQDPSINQSSKNLTLRKLLLSSGADMEDVEEEVPMSAQYMLQLLENDILKAWNLIPTNPTDDDEQHLIAMWDVDPDNVEMFTHQQMHIANIAEKARTPEPEQSNQMLNGAMSQAMSQAGSQQAKLNSNQ